MPLSAKFATALVDFPPAIFTLIPPLCPSGSEIHKTSNANRNLSVSGLCSSQWGDRLSCIAFREGQSSALCHGHDFFAVGLTTGLVEMYHADTSQAYKTLDHGEPVKFIRIRHRPRLLASCGIKTVKVWHIETGSPLHVFAAPQRPIALEFREDVLLVAISKGHLQAWDIGNQALDFNDRPWGDEDDSAPLRGQPSAIPISIPHQMLAVAYNGKPVILWDLEADSYYDRTGKKLSTGESSTHPVTALVFNPNQYIEMLAASYLDGDLVILDPFDGQEVVSTRAQCTTIAASPNGSSVREFHKHKSPARIVEWSAEGSVLLSVDISNSIIAWKLQKSPREGWVAERELFRSQLNCGDSIHQALLCESEERLILSTRRSDHLWGSDGIHRCTHQKEGNRDTRKWFQHPRNPALVVCFDGKEVQICIWDNLRAIRSFDATSKEQLLWHWECMIQYARYFLCQVLEDLYVDLPVGGTLDVLTGDHGLVGTTLTVVLTGAERPFTTRKYQLSGITKRAVHVLAVTSDKRLIFIDKKSWVCSVDLENADTYNGLTKYSRHFFAPHEWVAGSRHVICSTSANGREIVFGRNEDVVVVKNGLDLVDLVEAGCVGFKGVSQVANRLTVPVRERY